MTGTAVRSGRVEPDQLAEGEPCDKKSVHSSEQLGNPQWFGTFAFGVGIVLQVTLAYLRFRVTLHAPARGEASLRDCLHRLGRYRNRPDRLRMI